MVTMSVSMKIQAQWSLMKRILAVPERRRLIIRLLVGGAAGALTAAVLHATFRGLCRTPWEAVRLVVRLSGVVSATLVEYLARGCKPKFKNWTLPFELLRAVIRECTRGPHGERMVIDASHARVIRSQSAAFGTALGWFACRRHARRLEPVHANGLEHLWLRSNATKSETKRLVVLYVHGGGFALMSPRLYIAFGATLATSIEKQISRQLGHNERVQVDVFLGNYRKAPEHCFPTPPEDTVAAYKHLLHTEGIPPEQIILVGDSAGGGLVMSTLLRMRDANQQQHLPLAAMLICPAVDLSEIEAQGDSAAASANCLLSPEMIAAGRRVYHPTASDPSTWGDASSVHCDLRGLPPVFVQAATLDYLYQHSVRLVQKAKDDGVTNWELDVHEDLPHVFSIFPSYVLPHAHTGVQNMAAFAARHFTKVSTGNANNATATATSDATAIAA